MNRTIFRRNILPDKMDAPPESCKVRPFDNENYVAFRNARIERLTRQAEELTRHPHHDVIKDWKIPMFVMEQPVDHQSPNLVMSHIYADSELQWKLLLSHLHEVEEFAIQVLLSPDESYEGKYPAVIQISTRWWDWIIDVFPLWDKLCQLKLILENPLIIKIMHDCKNDLNLFQLFFDVYPVGIVDTQLVHMALNGGDGCKLRELSMFYCNNELLDDEKFDWRLRPLPKNMIDCARARSHVLFRIWQNMKFRLTAANDAQNENMYELTKTLTKSIILKRSRQTYRMVINRSIVPYENIKLFETIFCWRDENAMRIDCNPDDILSPHLMNKIAAESRIPRVEGGACHLVSQEEIEKLRLLVNEFAKETFQQQQQQLPQTSQDTIKEAKSINLTNDQAPANDSTATVKFVVTKEPYETAEGSIEEGIGGNRFAETCQQTESELEEQTVKINPEAPPSICRAWNFEYCLVCHGFQTGHASGGCPFKDKSKRGKGDDEIIAENKRLHEQAFPEDFEKRKAEKKASYRRSRSKRKAN